jgi:hypothetical protein
MKDTDKAGLGLFAAGILGLVFFVPIVILVGGTLGMVIDEPLLGVFIVAVFFTAWRVDRAQKARRRARSRT